MDKQTLKAQKRTVLGRKVKKLREENVLPANVYGSKVKSQAVQVGLSDFEKVFKITGETGLVELVVDKKKLPVLIHNVQKDPVSDGLLHADFLQVDLKQKVSAQVPVELSGTAPAEKQGGTVVQYINEIEVEALPTDLPDKFEVDLTVLKEIDQEYLVGDLKVDSKKVEVKNDPKQIIVKAEPPRKEEEEAPPPSEETEEEAVEGEEAEKEAEKEEAGEEKQESTPKEPSEKE